jgi:hypothetical protein
MDLRNEENAGWQQRDRNSIDPGVKNLPQRTRIPRKNIFPFDQFQIALPPNGIGTILRANRPLTRWAPGHPKK